MADIMEEVGSLPDASAHPPRVEPPQENAEASCPYVCACCFVWEVLRGPHAGKKVAFSTGNLQGNDGTASETTHQVLRVGRHSNCWLRLAKDLEVSGHHAELVVEISPLRLVLRDSKSTNGTKINGEAAIAGQGYVVTHQDLLQFGRSTVRVTMGNVGCPRALVKEEPVGEPEPPRAVVGEMADDDAFEDAAVVHVEPEQLPPSRPDTAPVCVVCGMSLRGWSVLESQLHVNACLDGGRPVEVSPQLQVETVDQQRPTGRKRKRGGQQATLLVKSKDDEEMALALALSESAVDEEQKVNMKIALVNSELAEIEDQIKKLANKKKAIIKSLEKLEKQKRKVHKSVGKAPDEIKALMDIELALRVLFPESRKVYSPSDSGAKKRKRVVSRLEEVYRSENACKAIDMADYVTMWRRAAQNEGLEGDDAVYVTKLLRVFRARAGVNAEVSDSCEKEKESESVTLNTEEDEPRSPCMSSADAACGEATAHCEGVDRTEIPDVVKRVFPNWRENLSFLKTQGISELKDALREMQQMRADRHARRRSNEDTNGEKPLRDDIAGNDDSGSARVDADDEDIACAFFEREMMNLITEKETCEPAVSLGVEVVNLVESQDQESEEVQEHEPLAQGLTIGECGVLSTTTFEGVQPDQSIILLDDSDCDDNETSISTAGFDDLGYEFRDVEDVEPEAHSTGADSSSESLSSSTAANSLSRPETVVRTDAVCEPETRRETSEPRGIIGDPGSDPNPVETTVEHQLLSALKSNALLYEAVLLLQPIDLHELHRFVRDDAGIKCPKNALVRFCDRHGITFKNGT